MHPLVWWTIFLLTNASAAFAGYHVAMKRKTNIRFQVTFGKELIVDVRQQEIESELKRARIPGYRISHKAISVRLWDENSPHAKGALDKP